MKDFWYTDVVITLGNVFFHSPDLSFDWNTIEDVERYSLVSVIRYEPWEGFSDSVAKKALKVTYVSDDLARLKMVSSGRADAFPNTLEVGVEVINTHTGLELGKNITYHPKPFGEGDYYLLVSKKAENAQKVVEIFNRGLSKIKRSGKYSAIRAKGE